ncbi:hypothetical protein FJ976_16500 [Mesorhizobium sp. B1-1-9]|uniref:hypothetical protein n=1 Tax=Mesorhizobium sp. B1-1-9 TaxID=2589975 RepID=UPI0011290AD4|nr:hypothetical protein [Mesorhizobium sp. B1-1-9]TPN50295.1 hypothetical protein FJ976_16500 [Mesorhizobium sp. B1-1-9]
MQRLTRVNFWFGSRPKMTDYHQSEVMKQPREKVRVTMDVGSRIDVAIAVDGVARGVYAIAGMASTLGTIIRNRVCLAGDF